MPEPDLKLDREIQMVRADWTGPKATTPEPFVLVGYESPYVLAADGRCPLVIDAEGVIFLSGAVYTWCHTGCCEQNPRRWPSVKEAADFHGSYVVGRDGSVRTPDAVGGGRED